MKTIAWARQPKKIRIRPARKPMEGHALSGVVIVVDGGVGYCCIKFDEHTVTMIGKKMPQGVGPESPAYLKVLKEYGCYGVYACYLDHTKMVKLWTTEKMPEWVKGVKYGETITTSHEE